MPLKSLNSHFFKIICTAISLVLLVLSFSKYSLNPEQPLNKSEKRIIQSIIAAKPVNINIATEDELMKLKGVGEKRAKAIIHYRKKHGRFKSINEIKRVPGFGARFIQDNKDLIVIKDF